MLYFQQSCYSPKSIIADEILRGEKINKPNYKLIMIRHKKKYLEILSIYKIMSRIIIKFEILIFAEIFLSVLCQLNTIDFKLNIKVNK